MFGSQRFIEYYANVAQFDKCLMNFFGKLDDGYNPNAVYHGSSHAADVMSTLFFFLQADFFRKGSCTMSNLLDIDYFLALVAGGIHDVGHQGRNNAFYTKTMHPLALRYNDKSPLESMHLATAFEIMANDNNCDWFKLLKEVPRQYARK